jgi:hypothetical protein
VIRLAALAVAVSLALPAAHPPEPAAIRGLSNAPTVVRAYDAILDADFADVPDLLQATCGDPTRQAVCAMLRALALWWEISLDPDSRQHDQQFAGLVQQAIDAADIWTTREPRRAEAWFYLGASYGARAQWRVLRQERLAAARDGKRIKEALERALALDPDLHDANFGIGMYRYYADVAPAALRMLRWLLLLPGGDRDGGLRQMADARAHGQLMRGDADYQLHLIYLWYENRPREALALVQGLQARYPHNPLFHHAEAEIQFVYFHDAAASYEASARLLALANAKEVHDPALASVRARLNMATMLDELGERERAIDLVRSVLADRPVRPVGSTDRARMLLAELLAELRTKN